MTDRSDRGARAAARSLLADLRALGNAPAPSHLAGQVMAATALGDAYAAIDTPLGPAFVAYTARGVSALALATSASEFAQAHQARTGRPVLPVQALPSTIAPAIAARLAGDRHPPRLRFDLRGLTTFEAAVLTAATTIPAGEVRPYGWVARAIGRPGAVRAVGTALGRNPIPLLIPCHRVVRADGSVGQYALGAVAKRRVLTTEGLDPNELDRLAASGVRYFGSDTTHIYCYPTCHHARRTSARHLMRFPSAAAASAAGYRPCRMCRPDAVASSG